MKDDYLKAIKDAGFTKVDITSEIKMPVDINDLTPRPGDNPAEPRRLDILGRNPDDYDCLIASIGICAYKP